MISGQEVLTHSDHLSPPSTTSRLSDSDTSECDVDGIIMGRDGTSISSLGSSSECDGVSSYQHFQNNTYKFKTTTNFSQIIRKKNNQKTLRRHFEIAKFCIISKILSFSNISRLKNILFFLQILLGTNSKPIKIVLN